MIAAAGSVLNVTSCDADAFMNKLITPTSTACLSAARCPELPIGNWNYSPAAKEPSLKESSEYWGCRIFLGLGVYIFESELKYKQLV
ncbi:hypothetical protein V6N13_120238 [Hibiscus sabdariffa]